MSVITEYEHVLRQVAAWPPEQRLSLAQAIVASVRPHPSRRAAAPRRTADRAYGLLKGPLPPPDDDDVKRILHEHRMEKYGR
jgi:hypothetical protein